MGKITGKVTKVETSEYSHKALGAMQQHKITVESDSGDKATASKHTKKSSQIKLPIGTDVEMSFEEQEVTMENGNTFLVKKVTKDGLILLNQNKQEKNTAATVNSAQDIANSRSNGQRNGMITGKAVELAISRKDTSYSGLLAAAKDVANLAKAVEENKLEEKPAKKAPVVEYSDDEECPFSLDN